MTPQSHDLMQPLTHGLLQEVLEREMTDSRAHPHRRTLRGPPELSQRVVSAPAGDPGRQHGIALAAGPAGTLLHAFTKEARMRSSCSSSPISTKTNSNTPTECSPKAPESGAGMGARGMSNMPDGRRPGSRQAAALGSQSQPQPNQHSGSYYWRAYSTLGREPHTWLSTVKFYLSGEATVLGLIETANIRRSEWGVSNPANRLEVEFACVFRFERTSRFES